MIFGSVGVLPVYGFLETYNMMVTNMKDYLTLDLDDGDADFRYSYGDTTIAQFKQDLCKKNSVSKIKVNVIKLLLSRTELIFGFLVRIGWVQYLIIFMILVITTMDWIILFAMHRYFLKLEISKNYWIYSDMKDSETNQKFYRRNLIKTKQIEFFHKKTDVYHIDDVWSLDILDLNDYGPENKKKY